MIEKPNTNKPETITEEELLEGASESMASIFSDQGKQEAAKPAEQEEIIELTDVVDDPDTEKGPKIVKSAKEADENVMRKVKERRREIQKQKATEKEKKERIAHAKEAKERMKVKQEQADDDDIIELTDVVNPENKEKTEQERGVESIEQDNDIIELTDDDIVEPGKEEKIEQARDNVDQVFNRIEGKATEQPKEEPESLKPTPEEDLTSQKEVDDLLESASDNPEEKPTPEPEPKEPEPKKEGRAKYIYKAMQEEGLTSEEVFGNKDLENMINHKAAMKRMEERGLENTDQYRNEEFFYKKAKKEWEARQLSKTSEGNETQQGKEEYKEPEYVNPETKKGKLMESFIERETPPRDKSEELGEELKKYATQQERDERVGGQMESFIGRQDEPEQQEESAESKTEKEPEPEINLSEEEKEELERLLKERDEILNDREMDEKEKARKLMEINRGLRSKFPKEVLRAYNDIFEEEEAEAERRGEPKQEEENEENPTESKSGPESEPQSSKSAKEKPGDFSEFGISENDLENIEGFNNLSEGQKSLVLENLKQLILGRIQEESVKEYKEDLKNQKPKITRQILAQY